MMKENGVCIVIPTKLMVKNILELQAGCQKIDGEMAMGIATKLFFGKQFKNMDGTILYTKLLQKD